MKSDTPAAKEREEAQVENRVAPPGEIVYEAIYREGEHELSRPARALAWSGLAAGLSMGFSFLAEALLLQHLPPAVWTSAVSKIGYSIGFVIVILGRQQLFSKNTLTVILPLLNRRSHAGLWHVARLWVIVLVANLVGALLFAWMLAYSGAFPPAMHAVFDKLGEEMPRGPFWPVMIRAVIAGWLIALMVWLLPFAETARVWIIVVIAYLVGLGPFPHIIAESVSAFYLLITGQVSLGVCLGGFMVPTFLGNVVGGVALVAALAHAELAETAKPKRARASRSLHPPKP
ncbi:formate/nitrite transporter family protein [Horticoccus luteus]|uniref:Formate/nitrite transporter family protein n=1 Tax=Horticoccus luteus TaxID=2862869 RepID=A0A8F9XKJ6_9BACT|nr:formate/nitrite transporter family protein [Horticoccus luteus]QYM78266.1 formate/nitrite transporter family protein [Horticoccus luteus]